MTEAEWTALLNFIDAGGTIAFLVVVVWAFFSGKVVPVSMLELVIAKVVQEVLEQLEARTRP